MDQKNFIVAIVLSVVIIMGWQTLFPAKHTPPPAAAADDQPADSAERAARVRAAAPGAPGAPARAGACPASRS